MLECKKILIVEVDHVIRTTLTTFIKGKHPEWKIIEAENAYQAMDLADSEKIDFFTIDYFLPSLTGLNLIIELKRVHTPGKFVLLTSPLPDHLKTEIEVMAIKHLDKPINQEVMQSIVRYFET